MWGKIQHLVRGGSGNTRLWGQVLGCAKTAQCVQPCTTPVGTKQLQSVQKKLAILAMNPQRIQSVSHAYYYSASLHSLKGWVAPPSSILYSFSCFWSIKLISDNNQCMWSLCMKACP